MNDNFRERLSELPDYLAGHLTPISALILGIAISIPLGVLASHSERARGPVLAVASLVQTKHGGRLCRLHGHDLDDDHGARTGDRAHSHVN